MVELRYNIFDDFERSFFSSRSWNISDSKSILALEILVKRDKILFKTSINNISWFG